MKYLSPFILQLIVWAPTRLILFLFGRFKVEGKENLKDLDGGVIFALNHSSELDVILLPASLNPFSRFFPTFYVARERKFYKKTGWKSLFYGGTWFKFWGAYPAPTGMKNYEKTLHRHIKILKDKRNLCVFPEGRKTETGKVQPARGGVVFLAEATGATIVPVAVSGHYKMTGWNFIFRKRQITLKFLKPVKVEDLHLTKDISYDQYKVIADQRVMRPIVVSQN